MAGFFDSNPQDTGAILAAQRRQKSLVDAVRDTHGGLRGVAPVQQQDGGVGLVSSTSPLPPANLPPAIGTATSLINSSVKSIDLAENAKVNRKALLEALTQKLPGAGTTSGPPGSQAAAQLPPDFQTPRGAAGYTSNPRGVPPATEPVHVGSYRMDAAGTFTPISETPLGLGSVEAWGAPLPAKTIEAEDQADIAAPKASLTAPVPPVSTATPDTPSLTAPTEELPPPEPVVPPPSLTEPLPPVTPPFEPPPLEEEFGPPGGDDGGDDGGE